MIFHQQLNGVAFTAYVPKQNSNTNNTKLSPGTTRLHLAQPIPMLCFSWWLSKERPKDSGADKVWKVLFQQFLMFIFVQAKPISIRISVHGVFLSVISES